MAIKPQHVSGSKAREDYLWDRPSRAVGLDRYPVLVGTVIGLTAIWAGVWRIGTTTVLFDEPIYAAVGRNYLDGDFSDSAGHPPLVTYLFGVAQTLLGEGVDSARVVSALASAVIAVLLWRLGTVMLGSTAGLVAAGLWIALPRSVGSNEVGTPGERLERFAYLEPVTAMFMLCALWFGWRLCQRLRAVDAIGLGCAVGLATGSKLTGVFIAIPIGLFLLASERRRAIGPLVLAGAVSVVAFLTTYAPAGRAADDALASMLEFQSDHADAGHLVFVAGESTLHPPWYTELWYHFDADGPWLTAAALALTCLAFLERTRRRAVLLCFSSVIGIYLCLSLLPFEIRHYRYVVWPPLVLLLAAGVTAAFGTASRSWRGVGMASLAVLVVVGFSSLLRLATLEPEDYAALGTELRERGFDTDTRIEVFGPLNVAAYHLPDWDLSAGEVPVTSQDADIVLVDSTYSVRFGDPTLKGVVDSFEMGRVSVFVLSI